MKKFIKCSIAIAAAIASFVLLCITRNFCFLAITEAIACVTVYKFCKRLNNGR